MYSIQKSQVAAYMKGHQKRTWYMGINSLALLIQGGWCCASFTSSIEVLLTTEFLPGKLSDG